MEIGLWGRDNMIWGNAMRIIENEKFKLFSQAEYSYLIVQR